MEATTAARGVLGAGESNVPEPLAVDNHRSSSIDANPVVSPVNVSSFESDKTKVKGKPRDPMGWVKLIRPAGTPLVGLTVIGLLLAVAGFDALGGSSHVNDPLVETSLECNTSNACSKADACEVACACWVARELKVALKVGKALCLLVASGVCVGECLLVLGEKGGDISSVWGFHVAAFGLFCEAVGLHIHVGGQCVVRKDGEAAELLVGVCVLVHG